MVLATRRVFGHDFVSDAGIAEVADEVMEAAGSGAPAWRCVVTPNVDHLVRYDRNAAEAAVARRSFLVLPDGMPIVATSRLLGRPLRSRLTGSDLFTELWARVRAADEPVVVVASSPQVAAGLEAEHRGVETIVPPFFDVADHAVVDALVDQIITTCARTGARLLFIGVSMPKHHLLADRLSARWATSEEPTPVVLLVGASPDLHLGIQQRAPRWMQRWGLEWLYRLAREPRRMARRYLVDDPRFVALAWREWRAIRVGATQG